MQCLVLTVLSLAGGVNSAVNSSQATLVYPTLQGMLCASPQQIGNLPEGFVLGVPQSSALALPQSDGHTGNKSVLHITRVKVKIFGPLTARVIFRQASVFLQRF